MKRMIVSSNQSLDTRLSQFTEEMKRPIVSAVNEVLQLGVTTTSIQAHGPIITTTFKMAVIDYEICKVTEIIPEWSEYGIGKNRKEDWSSFRVKLDASLEKHANEGPSGCEYIATIDSDNVVIKAYFENTSIGQEIMQDRANNESESSSQDKSHRRRWSSMLSELQEGLEAGEDPLYEQTDAGEYLNDICVKVEDSLGLEVEPSYQDGDDSVRIASDGEIVFSDSYHDFNDRILDIAFESKNMTQFKAGYRNYLLSIMS